MEREIKQRVVKVETRTIERDSQFTRAVDAIADAASLDTSQGREISDLNLRGICQFNIIGTCEASSFCARF